MGLQESVIGSHISYGKAVIVFKLKPLLTGFVQVSGRSVKIVYWRLR